MWLVFFLDVTPFSTDLESINYGLLDVKVQPSIRDEIIPLPVSAQAISI